MSGLWLWWVAQKFLMNIKAHFTLIPVKALQLRHTLQLTRIWQNHPKILSWEWIYDSHHIIIIQSEMINFSSFPPLCLFHNNTIIPASASSLSSSGVFYCVRKSFKEGLWERKGVLMVLKGPRGSEDKMQIKHLFIKNQSIFSVVP